MWRAGQVGDSEKLQSINRGTPTEMETIERQRYGVIVLMNALCCQRRLPGTCWERLLFLHFNGMFWSTAAWFLQLQLAKLEEPFVELWLVMDQADSTGSETYGWPDRWSRVVAQNTSRNLRFSWFIIKLWCWLRLQWQSVLAGTWPHDLWVQTHWLHSFTVSNKEKKIKEVDMWSYSTDQNFNRFMDLK